MYAIVLGNLERTESPPGPGEDLSEEACISSQTSKLLCAYIISRCNSLRFSMLASPKSVCQSGQQVIHLDKMTMITMVFLKHEHLFS